MKKWLITVALAIAPSASAGTITVWYAGNFQPHVDAVNKTVIPEFRKSRPDTTVRVEFVPWGDLSTKLNAAFAAGTAPDVFMHGAAATAGFAANSRVDSLENYLKEVDTADFGATLNQGKYNGVRFMLPVFGAGRLLVYRSDIFEQVGLDPKRPPRTWDELYTYAKKLTVRDASGRITRAGLLMPSSGTNLQQVFAPFFWQTGSEFFSENGRTATFNTPGGVKAVRFMQKLFDPKEGVSPLGDAPSPVNPLVTGQAAMTFAVSDEVAAIKTTNPDVYAKLVAAAPLKDKEQATFYSFSGFFLSKDSKNKAEAWKYMKFATTDKMLEVFNAAGPSIPPLTSLAGASFVKANPLLEVFVQNLKFAHGNPNVPVWVQSRDILAKNLEQALYGRITASEALNNTSNDVTKLLR